MPVRSLNSSVMKWPRRDEVDAAVRAWAAGRAESDRNVLAIGYFGSYARGDYGFGSDVDLIVFVRESARPFIERPLDWWPRDLPVHSDLLVYTPEEWDAMRARGEHFVTVIEREAVWVWGTPPGDSPPAGGTVE